MKTVVITVDEFIEIIDDRLESILSKISENKEGKEDELLTRHDLSKLFGVSLVTINEWCKKEILIPHNMNSRVYFKKSEVMEALSSSKYGRRNK